MKVILENKRIDQIPVLEYYQDMDTHKGLIFIQHGYQSTKEYGSDYLALTLAREGYFVVAIDAYKHGERICEPYLTGTEIERLDEAFVVIKRTALDIVRLHRNIYSKRFPTFDLIGISLGGMVAYYAATKTKHVRKLVPVISTPDFHQMAEYAVAGVGENIDTYFDDEKRQFINEIDPLHRLDLLQYKELFILCGDHDPVVPMEPSKAFFDTYKNNRMKMKIYDTDHNVPRQMQLDIFDFIKQ